jgi:Tol biopolymer transport system component
MTGHDDFDRTFAGWLEADALSPAPADGLDRTLDATRRRRPRPAWLAGPGSHWVGEAQIDGSSAGARSLPRLGVRWSTVLILLLVIAALLGGVIVVGARLFQPSPLPTSRLGQLAYGLDGDIFVADWDGRNPVRIADGTPADNSTPTCHSYGGEGSIWSPDGRHLAYRDGCGETVYISDPEGHRVASFPGVGWLVSWSPDGTRVATWIEERKTIGVYGVDGARQAVVTLPPEAMGRPGDFDPVWSPDGRSLLPPSHAWELPVDGGAARRVPDSDPRSRPDAVFSRDGARMAFGQPDSASLVIARIDGTELRVLAGAVSDLYGNLGPGPAYEDPVLSPTGDRVAFLWTPVVFSRPVDPASNALELRAVDVASGAVTTLASADRDHPLDPIAFSPDGDRILFSRTDANSVTSLWSIRTDGSDLRLLVTGTGWGDWQPVPAGP